MSDNKTFKNETTGGNKSGEQIIDDGLKHLENIIKDEEMVEIKDTYHHGVLIKRTANGIELPIHELLKGYLTINPSKHSDELIS